MMKVLVLIVVVVMVFAYTTAAYADNAGDKLVRGIKNSATGWLEIPKYIYEESQAHDPFTGLLYGSIKGSGMAISRSGVGAIDTGTFVLPEYDTEVLEESSVF